MRPGWYLSPVPDEVSYWYEAGNHSLFTYYFLKGMRGDADEDKDKKLTMKELYSYIEYEVASYAIDNNKPTNQTPKISGKTERIIAEYQ